MSGPSILGLSGLALLAALSTPAPARPLDADRPIDRPPMARGALPPERSQPADSAQRLSLLAAVDRALGGYPAVAASAARLDAADAAAGEALAARWPRLSLGFYATQYQEPMLVTPIHGFTVGTTPPFDETLLQGRAELSYTLFDGGARGGRIRQARELSASAEAGLEEVRQGVIAAVVSAYLETLSRRGVLEAHERQVAALEAERDRVRRLLEVGRAAEIERLRIEAALASAEVERVRTAAALDVSRRELARLIGAPPEETAPERLVPVSFAGGPLPAREELLAPALGNNPELERARRELAAADAAVSVAGSARWPRLDLAGAYVDRGSSDGDFTGEWNVGVQLSYPLFTGGEIGNAIEGAGARRRAAEEGLRLEELRVAGALDRAIAAVEEARARVAGLNTAVARSGEVARIEQLRLETGAGTQTDYLRAEADLLAARAGLVEAHHEELAARAELARVTGRLDRTWVSENLEEAR